MFPWTWTTSSGCWMFRCCMKLYSNIWIFCRPGLSSVVTGYLPSVILNGFIYIVPYSILGMAHLAGYPSRSQTEIKVCNMVFYFLVGNVFFLSLLSGSLLDELGASFSHPGDFPSHLAHAVAAQVRLLNLSIMLNFLWCFVSFVFCTTGFFFFGDVKIYGREYQSTMEYSAIAY